MQSAYWERGAHSAKERSIREEHGRGALQAAKHMHAGMRTCNADLLIRQDALTGLVTADCTACNAKRLEHHRALQQHRIEMAVLMGAKAKVGGKPTCLTMAKAAYLQCNCQKWVCSSLEEGFCTLTGHQGGNCLP